MIAIAFASVGVFAIVLIKQNLCGGQSFLLNKMAFHYTIGMPTGELGICLDILRLSTRILRFYYFLKEGYLFHNDLFS